MGKTSGTLKLAVIGAGGIGSYYGARLLSYGDEVAFVARGEHLVAMRQRGLDMRHPDFCYCGDVSAWTLDELVSHFRPTDFDLLLLCVKANATALVGEVLGKWFSQWAEGVPVISLQNGIDNEAILSQTVGQNYVIGGLAVRIGGHIIRPGQVEAKGLAEVIWGAWPDADSSVLKASSAMLNHWTEHFNAAGIPARLALDIRRELWWKLVINNGVNPLSALTGLDTRTLSHHELFGPLVRKLMVEAAAAARADHIQLDNTDVEEAYQLIRAFDPIKTSMLVDREKGRPLELDAISGAVLRRSQLLNLDAPCTETVYALLTHQLKNNDQYNRIK